MKIVNADQMRDLERQAAEVGLTSDILMENAGRSVAGAIRRQMVSIIGKCIVIMVGSGNNGGDGLVAARYLHSWGAGVTIYLCRSLPQAQGTHASKSTSGISEKNLLLAIEEGIPLVAVSDDPGLERLKRLMASADMVVDALLGTGKARPLEGTLASAAQAVSLARTRQPHMSVVAIDLPTGLNPDTGGIDPYCVKADMTLTLGYPKTGLLSFPGAAKVGALEVLDIGLPASLGKDITLELMSSQCVASTLPQRPPDANKGTFGHMLVISGSINYIGASHLACAAAARVGAGIVTLATPASLVPVAASKLTEITYLPLPEASPGILATIIDSPDLDQPYDICLIGCGLGQAAGATNLVEQVIFSGKVNPKGWVIDADALNILSHIPEWWRRVPGETVLTPHPGEMARLTQLTVERVQADRINVTRDAATKWGKTVVLKGAHTVVASPDGRAMVSPFANPGLASAGTGDVLAGTIAGLAAQGLHAYEAAVCGVYLHGTAGEELCQKLGPAGILASDMLPVLPGAMKSLRKIVRQLPDSSG